MGFGPRSCFDVETGESVLPIDVLTEADRRSVLEAKYGGTGGQELEAGMAIEEPDIGIGTGMTSKDLEKRKERKHKFMPQWGWFDPRAMRLRNLHR